MLYRPKITRAKDHVLAQWCVGQTNNRKFPYPNNPAVHDEPDFLERKLDLGAPVVARSYITALGRVWLADAKNSFLRKRPFPTVSKRSTVAPVNVVFGVAQPFSRNGRQRSKSTVFENDLSRSFSRPFLHPSPTSLPHTTFHAPFFTHRPHHFPHTTTTPPVHDTCDRSTTSPKNTAPPPIAPRHFPHTSTGRPPTTTITVHDVCDRSGAS